MLKRNLICSLNLLVFFDFGIAVTVVFNLSKVAALAGNLSKKLENTDVPGTFPTQKSLGTLKDVI